jgi:arylsulfatase A-like enzyme
MSLRSAVVVVVDRMGAAYLGPYGNTWLETPAFSSLASRALLAETFLADSPQLADAYRSYWPAALPADLATRGIRAVLVTDEPQVTAHPLAESFADKILVPAAGADQLADEAASTGIGRLFAAAAEALAGLAPPYLLWIHARGMDGPWDAPREFREQFRDEEDPEAGDFVKPPQMQIDDTFDPDELLKLTHAYAGQVSLLDGQLAALLEMIAARGENETLVAVTSPRGYPLGEHGRVGPCDEALYGELLQVPLLVQFPGQRAALARTHELLQPADLGAALAEHFGLSSIEPSILWQIARNESHAPRDVAVAVGHEQRAIRTPAWFFRESIAEGAPRHELFAKPDDRFEVNEVSSRCGHEVELLAALLDRHRQPAPDGSLAPLAPLPELLRDVWR